MDATRKYTLSVAIHNADGTLDFSASLRGVTRAMTRINETKILDTVFDAFLPHTILPMAFDTVIAHHLPAEAPYGLDFEVLKVSKGQGILWSDDLHAMFWMTGLPSLRSHSKLTLIQPKETRKYVSALRKAKAEINPPWFRTNQFGIGTLKSAGDKMVRTVSPIIIVERALFDFTRDLTEMGVDGQKDR